MSLSTANGNIHLNPRYKLSKNHSDPRSLRLTSERQHSFTSQFDKHSLNPSESASAILTKPLSSRNSTLTQDYSVMRKSPYSIVNTAVFDSSKRNVYKWENKEAKSKLRNAAIPETRGFQSSSFCNSAISDKCYQKVTLNNLIESIAKNHHRSSIPFYSHLSKGWFSVPPCSTSCVTSTTFDLQSCCFISNRFLPANTLSLLSFQGTISSSKVENKKADLENKPSLVKLSKHKLIRKPQQRVLLKNDRPTVLCTERKLIREVAPAHKVQNQISLPSRNINQSHLSKLRNSIIKVTSSNSDSFVRRKNYVDLPPPVVLTERKLIRKTESSTSNDTKKAPVSISPTKLIRVNRNKLIRSSLLQKFTKKSAQNYINPVQSVLSHMIQYRRRPYPGSSHVLLTRNKIVRRVRYKNKVWKKNTSDNTPKMVSKKGCAYPKIFVSVGKNKLIRKSLFTKTNKVSPSKNNVSSISPLKNKLLTRILNSPGRRVQTFTNHLSRRKLKYLASSSTLISRTRFSNKCKNNKRILRRKNSVCPTFRRKGECIKKISNNCSYLHDKKYIMICKNYMKGVCENKNCLLSHDLIPQKAPVCLHFLNGNCEASRCQFLHVKLDPNAPICAQFLRGYCEAAEKCIRWHVYACPQYKNSAKCDKGDTCHLPHRELDYFEGNCSESNNVDDENIIPWRYFEKNKLDEKDLSGVQIIPERHSLGILPDFIPL